MYTSPWIALHNKVLASFDNEWFIIVLFEVSLRLVFPPCPFTQFLWLVSGPDPGPSQLMFSVSAHRIMSFGEVWYYAFFLFLLGGIPVCSYQETAPRIPSKTWKTKHYVFKIYVKYVLYVNNFIICKICKHIPRDQQGCPGPWYLLHPLQEISTIKLTASSW